ncbi:MAG: AsmA-like C-terminal region-containing protein [Prosthecobacter sp.]|nr:AsmA-like C-terminal region-containing protein [Prosthecobacter sp.]
MLLASGLLAGIIYLSTDAFAKTWREFVIAQMAERGLHLDFERLVLNPFGGLVAQEVRIFSAADHQQVLAAVDRLNLDFDLGKLLERKVIVEELELRNANLALPVDPESDDQTVIELKDLSARAFLLEGHLDVRQAEGTLSGIRLNLTGDITLPPKKPEAPGDPKQPTTMQRLESLREHRQLIRKGLDWLQRFEFAAAPRVTVEVHGTVERPAEMTAKVFFEAQELRYGSYVCRELLAEAEYNAGLIDLTRLQLKDRTGEVLVSASWRMGAEDLRFNLTSSADLPGLAEAFLNSDNLREIVFYEPPHLALRGLWHVGGPLAQNKRPVQVIGRLECGRFSSRGEVFNGLSANIGVAPEGVYLRDVLLRHQTGTLEAQALIHDTEGVRYRAVLRMDPRVFAPFSKQEQTRELLRRFEFTPKSEIYFAIEGSGPVFDPQQCLNLGRAEVKHFAYRGMAVEAAEADVEFQGPVQHFRNIKLKRPEGLGAAAHVHVNHAETWVRLEGVKTSVDPVALINCFSPKIVPHVARYQLPNTTAVDFDGVIYWKDARKNDFHVKFRHPEGPGHYMLWGQDYPIGAPAGLLKFKGNLMSFDISGRVFGDAMFAKGRVDLTPGENDFAVNVKAGKFPYGVFKKQVPFEGLTATVTKKAAASTFDVRASLLGGNFSLEGTTDGGKEPDGYQGELRVEGVSFKRFAQIYSKHADTEGDLTGHFKFGGRAGDWKTLKGTGVAIILNGNLYSVPILGPLTPLLGGLLPGQSKDYNIAKEANCTFEVADGVVKTHDFEALTNTLRILASGQIDFINDDLDFTAQVRVRGLPGLVLMPFTELFEYHGQGTITDTQWKPSLLQGANAQRAGSQRRPLLGGDKTEEPVAGEEGKPAVGAPKRTLPSFFNRAGGR